MDERPNADDMLARAHRAEAYAEELAHDREEAMDALELIAVSDPAMAQGIARETLATINGRALV
jgi:hypothetical protein